jgi:hypothetical protein
MEYMYISSTYNKFVGDGKPRPNVKHVIPEPHEIWKI